MARRLVAFSMNFRAIARIMLSPRIAASSLRIALIVGLVLNAINQGGALLDGQPLRIGHFLMNFLVPFCVAGFSAAKNELNRR